MTINTEYAERCIATLDVAFIQLQKQEPESIEYDIFRAACVKEFELVLEQCNKLLKRVLLDFLSSKRQLDRLNFKDVFRHASKHDLITVEACERWFKYRDNRNNTAHDYGEGFAESTLVLIPDFICDARAMMGMIRQLNED